MDGAISMRMRFELVLVGCLLGAAVQAGENSAAPRASASADARVCQLILKLGADTWGEREDAMAELMHAGPDAILHVEAAIAESDDAELLWRAQKVYSALRLAPIQGHYKQVSIRTHDAAGNELNAGSGNSRGELSIEGSRVTWSQWYSGNTTIQTYSLSDETFDETQAERTLPLTFLEMDASSGGYSPEADDTWLKVKKIANGYKLTFHGTDKHPHTSDVEFEPMP